MKKTRMWGFIRNTKIRNFGKNKKKFDPQNLLKWRFFKILIFSFFFLFIWGFILKIFHFFVKKTKKNVKKKCNIYEVL